MFERTKGITFFLIPYAYKIIIFIILFVLAPIDCLPCTSFCIVNEDTVLLGHNLDWHVGEGMIFVNKRNVTKKGFLLSNSFVWTSKYGSVTINQVGREFPMRGMNEKGLVIVEMRLTDTEYPAPDSRAALFPFQWMQYQLDNCATIEEVIETNSNVRIKHGEFPSHYLILDSSGSCVTMEWFEGKLVYHTGKSLPVKTLTDSAYDYCIKHCNGDDISFLAGTSALSRFCRSARMIKEYNPTSHGPAVDYAFEVLSNVRHTTRWSLVFDSKNLIFYFRTDVNHDVGYVEFKSLDFSCDSPVKLFNVSKQFKGNTLPFFTDYEYQINYDFIKIVFEKYKFSFSESVIEMWARYPESTTCNSD